jgi:hypothetical protein
MSKCKAFTWPRRVTLTFPDDATDTERVLYALWTERVQSLERLWLHTGLPPARLMNAVIELACDGRIRADDFREWTSVYDADAAERRVDWDIDDDLATRQVALA